MLAGHYAPAFVLKRYYREVPLWQLMIAVQFLDVLFFTFVPLGLESFHSDPHEPGFLALKLTSMTFSHSLLMTLIIGMTTFIAGRIIGRPRLGLCLSLAVMSHWFLDLIVHTPDLPLGFGESKAGFGLWTHPTSAFLLEIALLAIGAAFIVRTLNSRRNAFFTFVALLIGVQFLTTFIFPVPTSPIAIAVASQFFYFSVAAIGFAIEHSAAKKTTLRF